MEDTITIEVLNQQLQELSEETILFHEALANKVGLHITDHKCLAILGRTGPLTATQLSARLGLSKSAVTFMIDRLEEKGLVHRIEAPNDRRKILVQPTRGAAVSEQIQAYFRLFDQDMKEELGKYTQEELKTVLRFALATKTLLQKHSLKSSLPK